MTSLPAQMIRKAHAALTSSYSPYSKFAVACCIATDKDILFTGVNVENAAYGLTICAETSAICHMITEGYRDIKSMVIMNNQNTICPPCGACRQRIHEFAKTDTIIYLADQEKILITTTISALLPLAFNLSP